MKEETILKPEGGEAEGKASPRASTFETVSAEGQRERGSSI